MFKNSFIADGRTNKVTLKPGKYKFTLYGGLPVDIEVEIREEYEIPEAPLERIKANMKDIRRAGAEYRKPNLPKESMSEVDDEGDDGTVTNSST